MENFKFYILQGNKAKWTDNTVFELRKIITMEVKKGKLKIDKDLSLDFIESEKLENFMYNLKFSNATFKGFIDKEEMESYIKQRVDDKQMQDLRRKNDN